MQRRPKDDTTLPANKELEYFRKFSNWCYLREDGIDELAQKLKGNSTTNEELHNLIVQRIHSKIDFLKDAVSKFEKTLVNDTQLRAKLSNTLLSDFSIPSDSSKKDKDEVEEEIERDGYLIKFSYKLLKFAYTLSHFTNGAVRCIKLSASSHEYERLKAKVIRRIAPGYFQTAGCEYSSVNFLSFYWIHNDLLAQNFQTKIAKYSSPRVMDMFTVTHRRMLKSTIINGFGGNLNSDDVALLFDDFWTIDRPTNSTYYQMLAKEERPTFPAVFSYFSTLESEMISNSKRSNRILRFLLMCKVLTKEKNYENMRKDEWMVSDPSLVLPEFIIVYEFLPKERSNSKSKTNFSENVETLEQDKIMEHQQEAKNNLISEISKLEDECKREQLFTRQLHEKLK